MLGSVFDKGSAAPDLHTEIPLVLLFFPTQVVRYNPSSWHTVPEGQQVWLFAQQTASLYGQQPSPFTAYAARQTVPTWHTWPPGLGLGEGGAGGDEQFSHLQPDV